jgi:hypothetical protein
MHHHQTTVKVQSSELVCNRHVGDGERDEILGARCTEIDVDAKGNTANASCALTKHCLGGVHLQEEVRPGDTITVLNESTLVRTVNAQGIRVV